MAHSADVDIDVADRNQILALIKSTAARQLHNGKIRRHNSGIYVTPIPYDPYHKCASIDYNEAADRGYFKIDLLNMSVYTLIRDYEHYEKVLNTEPNWSLLWSNRKLSEQIIHVGNYYDLLGKMKPDSILKMAAFISIIRPGKAHLQNKSWEEIFETVWDRTDVTAYTFRKSHAVSYAMLVKLHLNLLTET